MKRKWYRSNIVKALLIIAAHITAVVIVACFLWITAYPTLRVEIADGNPAREYKDTRNFASRMEGYSRGLTSGITAKRLFEDQGKYNPDKLVDLEEYYNTGTFTGKKKDGLVYKLGSLLDWYHEMDGETDTPERIIVCKKKDGTYFYYRISEFYELVSNDELQFAAANEESGYTEQGILADLESGYDMPDLFRGIQDREGKMIYSDFWVYDGVSYSEKYKPVGAESILELGNKEERWNGKINEAYNMLYHAVNNLGEQYDQYEGYDISLSEGDTNFYYLYVDVEDKYIYTNKKEYAAYADIEESLEDIRKSGKYVIVKPKRADFETNIDLDTVLWCDLIKYGGPTENFIYAAYVDTKYPIKDEFYRENQLYERYGSSARRMVVWVILSMVVFIGCILWLVVTAGRSAEDEELHLNWFDCWKTELAAAVVIFGWIVPTFAAGVSIGWGAIHSVVQTIGGQFIADYSELSNAVPYIIGYSILGAFTCSMFLIGLLSLVRRMKAKTVWKNSILKNIVQFVCLVFENMNSIWKTIIMFGAFVSVQMIAAMDIVFEGCIRGFSVFLVCAIDITAFIYLVYRAVGKHRIKTGIERIADGEVDYVIPTDRLRGTQKEIAIKINSISEGLDAALEKSMRSERLKTDLITNVSHDIKTPLTSIINYVELLKQEKFEDPKIVRYIEVLEQKSQRLKTLTEDVVEASKVSSGNITLEYMKINFVEMIQQTSGEFEEKFAARELKEVLTLPDEDALIWADGRRTWRILENIYNNAAKYAMEGTRVYGDLEAGAQEVCFTLKNVSEQALNISADELTERFIRGDISRSTEGSGLGLSIAKTLTQMQGGSFELYLDGDLFKVTIVFPRVR